MEIVKLPNCHGNIDCRMTSELMDDVEVLARMREKGTRNREMVQGKYKEISGKV